MSDSSTLREQGLKALQENRLDQAVELLVRAVMQDDNDLDAKVLLGVAYSLKGLHAQAKRALQTAVERAPQNATYRYNLGVALQQAGDLQGAAIAYRDTLQLDPKHASARAKLQAMGPEAHRLLANAPKPIGPVGVPVPSAAASGSGVGEPPSPAMGLAAQPGPPGTRPCARCGQPTPPGISCTWCGAPPSGPTR